MHDGVDERCIVLEFASENEIARNEHFALTARSLQGSNARDGFRIKDDPSGVFADRDNPGAFRFVYSHEWSRRAANDVNVRNDAEIIALQIEPEAKDALPILAQALGGPGGPAGVTRAEVAGSALTLEFRPALTPWSTIRALLDTELARFGSTTRRTVLRSELSLELQTQIAADGLIPGVPSITVPRSVPIPFRDYPGSLRFDWAQSTKSQWFLRASEDSYLTRNALVAQATLPSTGLTTHNNYWNSVLSNTYAFSPTWLGTFVFDTSLLHLTQTRNSTLGFALAFAFSSTTLTVSGFETYGDNQFATPITLFPSLHDQQKYQFRYDLDHVTGDHSFKFVVNFIHEPVRGGAFPVNEETLPSFPNDPTFYTANPAQFVVDYENGAATTPETNGSFSQSVQRLAFYAQDSWRLSRHLTLNYGARYDRFASSFDNEAQLSPRVNLVWKIDNATTAHAGYARYFVPPPVQYVWPFQIQRFAGTSTPFDGSSMR